MTATQNAAKKTERELILGWVDKHAEGKTPGCRRTCNHPGLPEGHVPLHMLATLRAMIKDGTLRLITEQRPNPLNPGTKTTYIFLARARG
jgi:hypothetical protein